jgi:aspartate racemase
MKTLGIIGGIGPESTIAYYRMIVDHYRKQRPDDGYPSLIINSIDMMRMLNLIGDGAWTDVMDYLLDEIHRLANAGSDFGLLASNTPHAVFDELRRQSPIPLVSIVETACETVHELELKKVGLFGTRFTMTGAFYPDVFLRKGIEIILPDSNERELIHVKYMSELVNGIIRDETREMLLKIADRMIREENIQGLILGGTELPLILREDAYRGIPFFDTARIHVKRAVELMLVGGV